METINKTNLSKRQQLELIKKISYCLQVLDNISWTNYYSDYLKENIREEKNHRGFKPDGIESGITTMQGGMFFSVQQIIRFLEGEEAPDLSGYLFMRKTIFTAYSIVQQYKDNIQEALKDIDYKPVLDMDYCYLVQYDNKGIKLY